MCLLRASIKEHSFEETERGNCACNKNKNLKNMFISHVLVNTLSDVHTAVQCDLNLILFPTYVTHI